MMRRPLLLCSFLLTLCACSGGGGGTPPSSSTPAPTPTPTSVSATATPTAAATATPTAKPSGTPATATPTPFATVTPSTGISTYSVLSAPSSLGVTVTNGTSVQHVTTPASITPVASNVVTTIAITPSNGAAVYSVPVDQQYNGGHTILYNQNADTQGSLATISPTAAVRMPAARARTFAAIRRVGPQRSSNRPAYSDRDLIVRYRANVPSTSVERSLGVARAYALRAGADGSSYRVLDVPAGIGIDEFAQRLRARSEIVSVERDELYYKESVAAVIPNDTHFDAYDQWDMFDIGAPNAWGYTKGSSGVQIAMVDTGADSTVPDLAGGKIVHAESIVSGTTTVGLAAVRDTDGHGTNTAGIAAAATNNDSGFAGTGYNVGLQIYKVFPDDTASNNYMSSALGSDVTAAIDAAVTNGARVINLSLGSCQLEGVDSAQQAAIADAIAKGVVVVAAAGNERSDEGTGACAGTSSTIDFPAAFPGVISVGATSLDDTADPMNPATAKEFVASYSNSGPGLSIVAPGGDPTAAEVTSTGTPDVLHWILNLYSTTVADPSEQCSNPSDCAALFAGTSQATPHVSGAAALMLSKNGSLTPAQVKQILIATADDIKDPNQGNGRLDAYRALAVVDGDPSPPAQPTEINFVAIAYVPNGTTRPQIVDVTYPRGVPVSSTGTFRIADVPTSTAPFKIAVWYDANGDGLVDAGDYFGSSQTCTASAPCTSAKGLVASPVTSGFVP